MSRVLLLSQLVVGSRLAYMLALLANLMTLSSSVPCAPAFLLLALICKTPFGQRVLKAGTHIVTPI